MTIQLSIQLSNVITGDPNVSSKCGIRLWFLLLLVLLLMLMLLSMLMLKLLLLLLPASQMCRQNLGSSYCNALHQIGVKSPARWKII